MTYNMNSFINIVSIVERRGNFDKKCSPLLLKLSKINTKLIEKIYRILHNDFQKAYKIQLNTAYKKLIEKTPINSEVKFDYLAEEFFKKYIFEKHDYIFNIINSELIEYQKKVPRKESIKNQSDNSKTTTTNNQLPKVINEFEEKIQKQSEVDILQTNNTSHETLNEPENHNIIFYIVFVFVIIVILSKYSKRQEDKRQKVLEEEKKRKEEEYQKIISAANFAVIDAAENLQAQIYSIICNHIDVLLKKKRQKVRYDDYGNMLSDAWDKEFNYFCKSTVLPQTKKNIILLACKKADAQNIYNDIWQALTSQRSFDESYCSISNNCYFESRIIKYTDILVEENEFGRLKKMLLNNSDFLENNKAFFDFAKEVFFYLENITLDPLNDLDEEDIHQQEDGDCKKISIDSCTAKEFERKVADKLSEIGFMTEVTKYVGDQGADVLAEKNGVTFAIQCKLYSDSVGNKALQEAISGKNYYKADYAVVVTNSHFTKQAHELADKTNSILLHYSALDKLNEYCVEI